MITEYDHLVAFYLEALNSVVREGIHPIVQVMLPFTITSNEIDWLHSRIRNKLRRGISIGTMIETPRACIRADRIAALEEVKFISFGTNDLTQLVMGMSRDDTQKYLVSNLLSMQYTTSRY